LRDFGDCSLSPIRVIPTHGKALEKPFYVKCQQAVEYFVVSFKELRHGIEMKWQAVPLVLGGNPEGWDTEA